MICSDMFFHRTALDALMRPASRAKVCLLFGARQTGKTTLLRHVLARAGHARLYDRSSRT